MLNLQPKSGCSRYLIKLSGLPVEFRGVMLAHNHQYGVGRIHERLRGPLQAPLWAVPLSILPGRGADLGQDRGKPLPHPGPPRRVRARGRGEAGVTHRVMRRGAF